MTSKSSAVQFWGLFEAHCLMEEAGIQERSWNPTVWGKALKCPHVVSTLCCIGQKPTSNWFKGLTGLYN